ncbi:XdhC family protein [Pseudomonas typographi]|uniref:XdhC family protein n=1 Tax=Pseudomonas typographi TaxID=2715964 RepID=UPI0016836E4E|nr:XdhC family protein [Pseudomonas typographi]MBD1588779.1 XdhC family protein [Pseudomonas typographi]
MQPLDQRVINSALQWLGEGRATWLCTVLSTYGSAPRGPGSMLAFSPGLPCTGSLSGGCVEEDLLQRLANHPLPEVSTLRYGAGGIATGVELPCGGSLDVLVESLGPAHLSQLRQIAAALGGRERVLRSILPHGAALEPCDQPGPTVERRGQEILIRLGPVQRLLVAGLSPVAQYCAEFAQALDFDVVVCDPREGAFERFAPADVTCLAQLPARYIAAGHCHAHTAIVALTHDPRLDDLTLMEAVRSPAFYIGAMGSTRTSERRFERLRRSGGLDAAALARVHAPIGLKLGSKTPAHIALAVLADIVRVANGVPREQL